MPVGHGGDMSKHKANEKIAILEFIEARLKDIIISDPDTLKLFSDYVNSLREKYDLPSIIIERLNALNDNIKKRIMADLIVKVYDPFSTEMDFYFFLNVNWTKYEEIYGKYYNEGVHGSLERAIDARYAAFPEILKLIHGGNYPDGVFNASRSKSIIFHTISEMREIIGLPVIPVQ